MQTPGTVPLEKKKHDLEKFQSALDPNETKIFSSPNTRRHRFLFIATVLLFYTGLENYCSVLYFFFNEKHLDLI